MTREHRIDRRAAELLAQALNKELWQMLLTTAMAQAEDEIGPPPYKPYGWNRVNLDVRAEVNGAPMEDL